MKKEPKSERGLKAVRRIDWAEYSRLCQLLASQILAQRDPEAVVGIAHGGAIVGATIAALMGRDFYPIKFSRRVNAQVVRKHAKLIVPPTADLEGKRVLVVDDACRTGETMGAAVRALRSHGAAEVYTAVLIQAGNYPLDYAGSYYKGELLFPWQMEEAPASGARREK